MLAPATKKTPLWPFGIAAALVSIPLIWIGMVLLLMITTRVAAWPDAESRVLMTYVTLVVSIIPLALVLFDFAADRQAVFGFKGVSIDFSKIDLTESRVNRDAILLPDNIGQPGPIVTDSTPMEIVKALADAAEHEVVRIDLGSGDSWWSTRLLALAAGAVRVGHPRAFVFVARRNNVEGSFLGWVAPAAVQASLLQIDQKYQDAFTTAKAMTAQLVSFHGVVVPATLPLNPRYLSDARYASLGEAAFEQILLDQLAAQGLENAPDRLTLTRFADLLEPFAYRDAIDPDWPNDQRIAMLLDTSAEYVALTRGGRYESIVHRRIVERLILRELVRQSQQR